MPTAARGGRAGVTLVELLVALAVLGIMATVAGLALQAPSPGSPSTSEDARSVAARARSAALRTGQPVTLIRRGPDGPAAVTAFPDGRVVGVDLMADSDNARQHAASAGARRGTAAMLDATPPLGPPSRASDATQ